MSSPRLLASRVLTVLRIESWVVLRAFACIDEKRMDGTRSLYRGEIVAPRSRALVQGGLGRNFLLSIDMVAVDIVAFLTVEMKPASLD